MFKICHYQLRKRKLCLFEQDYFEKSQFIIIYLQYIIAEAVAQRCFLKKVFLEISQNSQENTCARVSFLKSCRPEPCNFIKNETLAQVFSCEFCEISKNTFFHRTPLVAASVTARNSAETVRSTKCPHQ